MCGEQLKPGPLFSPTQGSPPRVRGTVVSHGIQAEIDRITPACAGNRVRPLAVTNGPWDHPRVCGEQLGALRSYRRGRGSPPRVRGTGLENLLYF